MSLVFMNHSHRMDRLRRKLRKSNQSAPIIVDIQCFKDNKNEYILKEVCVLDGDTGVLLMHHIAKPPYNQSELSDNKLKESYWLTKHCHGLQWEDGDIPFYELHNKLTDCISNHSTVFVKGLEKKEYLKRNHVAEFVTTNIIDVTNIGCGSISSMNNLMSTNIVRCHNHNSTNVRCALTNCISLRGWLHLTTKINKDEDTYFCSCFSSTSTSTVATAVGYDTVE